MFVMLTNSHTARRSLSFCAHQFLRNIFPFQRCASGTSKCRQRYLFATVSYIYRLIIQPTRNSVYYFRSTRKHVRYDVALIKLFAQASGSGLLVCSFESSYKSQVHSPMFVLLTNPLPLTPCDCMIAKFMPGLQGSPKSQQRQWLLQAYKRLTDYEDIILHEQWMTSVDQICIHDREEGCQQAYSKAMQCFLPLSLPTSN